MADVDTDKQYNIINSSGDGESNTYLIHGDLYYSYRMRHVCEVQSMLQIFHMCTCVVGQCILYSVWYAI